MLVSDDQFKPDVAKQLFEKNIKRDKVDFMTGVVFSNIMLAALPEAFDNKTIYISPNAAPSSIAGKDCNPLLLRRVVAERRVPRGGGPVRQHARPEERLPGRAELPGRQGFARRLQAHFKGQVVGEIYTKLGQLDYAAELAEIRAAKPRGASTSSCPAAWASTSSSSSSAPASART